MSALAVAAAVSCASHSSAPPPLPTGIVIPTFQGDRARSGSFAHESALTPAKVASGAFGPIWSSPPLDALTANGVTYAPHLFASPLYADGVVIDGGPYAGLTTDVVFVASTNGFVYAIAAFPTRDAAAGTILWRAGVGTPALVAALDGMPLGVLGTPYLDAPSSRLYVASVDASDGTPRWKVYALDARSGALLPGWPVAIDDARLREVNGNAATPPGAIPPRIQPATVTSQRGALNLSPDGATLYVPFGSYFDGGVGWMVAVDTRAPKIAAAFSGSARAQLQCPTCTAECTSAYSACRFACQARGACDLDRASGGMWSAGGASVADDGRVFMTTGNGPPDEVGVAGSWGQSLLVWDSALRLLGTYTPFNYCALDAADADLGGSSPVLLPAMPGATPNLVAFGCKQGDVYLVDRDRLPGRTDARPACDPAHLDPASDRSLLPPSGESYYGGARGPLNVFGPYSDAPSDNNLNAAKMRTTPAVFRADDGATYLYAAGTTKSAADARRSVPPSVVKLRVVAGEGQAAYLEIAAQACAGADATCAVAMKNPGSPVVTSDGGRGPVVWVLDENGLRTDRLVPDPSTGYTPPQPILYAFDGGSLALLFQSAPLHTGGKYSVPVVAHGTVLVGTDRVEAFGLR